jgi:MFS family permease
LVGLTAMSVIRGSVGFVTFFLAFALKRENPPAATWLYGVIVLASGVGGLAGSMLVPWLRRHLSEERIILASLISAATFAGVAALIGGLWSQPILTCVIALAGTTAKPSFDSLAQRHVPPLMQGRAFARFETRLQLIWVIAAVIAVVINFGFVEGDVVIGVACAVAAVFYGSMLQTLHRHEIGQQVSNTPVSPLT